MLLWLQLLLAPVWAASPLNPLILDLIAEYPLGEALPYAWIRGQDTDGVSQLVQWDGVTLAAPSAVPGVHCSGITFEVFIRALSQRSDPTAISPAQLLALKEAWYNREESETGPVDALIQQGLGERVETLEELQPGDFVQFWRNNGNGHSAIFIQHTTTRSGAVRGMVFWSAQASSGGLGYRRVSVGSGEFQIAPGRLYGVRAVEPALATTSAAR